MSVDLRSTQGGDRCVGGRARQASVPANDPVPVVEIASFGEHAEGAQAHDQALIGSPEMSDHAVLHAGDEGEPDPIPQASGADQTSARSAARPAILVTDDLGNSREELVGLRAGHPTAGTSSPSPLSPSTTRTVDDPPEHQHEPTDSHTPHDIAAESQHDSTQVEAPDGDNSHTDSHPSHGSVDAHSGQGPSGAAHNDAGDDSGPTHKALSDPMAQEGSSSGENESSSAGPADDRMCRICFCGSEDGRLISPCLCKGSMKYVHVDCLQHWRSSSSNSKSYFQCDTCHYKYHLQRTFWANVISSWIVLQLVTLCAFVVLLFFSGYLGKLLRWSYVSYAYDDLTEAELYDDIHEYGGVLPWFLFDVYATHWALGAMVVGITGFFALIGTGFGWPYINFRRENGVLILIIVIVGLVSAFVSLYRIVRAQSQKMLAKFEEVVMEVQDDEHGQTYQANRQGTATTPAAAAAAAGGVAAGPAHAHAMDGMQYIRLRAGMR